MEKYLIIIAFVFLCGCGEKNLEMNKEIGKGKEIKVIKFYAEWCGPCKKMKPIYDVIKKNYMNIDFEEIDIDKNRDMAIKYKVERIPLVVIESKGKEINRNLGYMGRNDFIRFIEKTSN